MNTMPDCSSTCGYTVKLAERRMSAMDAPTLAQVTPEEAVAAMRFAGGFDREPEAA